MSEVKTLKVKLLFRAKYKIKMIKHLCKKMNNPNNQKKNLIIRNY